VGNFAREYLSYHRPRQGVVELTAGFAVYLCTRPMLSAALIMKTRERYQG
jgi:hypothetical protein